MVAISGLLPIVAGAFYIGQATALPVIVSDDPAPQHPTEEPIDLTSLPLVLSSIIEGVEEYVPPADIQEKLKALERNIGVSDVSRQSFPGQDNPMIKPTRDSDISEAVHLFLDEVLRSVLTSPLPSPSPWTAAELKELYTTGKAPVRLEETNELTPDIEYEEREGGNVKRGIEMDGARTIALDAAYYKVKDRFFKLLWRLKLRTSDGVPVEPLRFEYHDTQCAGGKCGRDNGGGQCGGGKCGRDNGGGQCGGGKCGRDTGEGQCEVGKCG